MALIKLGDDAPNFTVKDNHDQNISLSNYRGKKAWATSIQINTVSLPSDFWPHGKVAQDYELFNQTEGVSERANVIVDENGKVKFFCGCVWYTIFHKLEIIT